MSLTVDISLKRNLRIAFNFFMLFCITQCFIMIIACSSLRCLTSTQDAKAGELCVQGQPSLYSKTLKEERGEKERGRWREDRKEERMGEWKKGQRKRGRKERRHPLCHPSWIPDHWCDMGCHLTFTDSTPQQHPCSTHNPVSNIHMHTPSPHLYL